MSRLKNVLKKIDFYCLRTNKYPFLCLRTSKTFSSGEFDKSKTHLFLSPFFKNISGLKVQFNAELLSFHPNFLFCRNLKETSRIQHKKEHKSVWFKQRANVATSLQRISNVTTLCGESLEIMSMSRHQLHKG